MSRKTKERLAMKREEIRDGQWGHLLRRGSKEGERKMDPVLEQV